MILTSNGSALLGDSNNVNESGYKANVGYMNDFDYSIGQNTNFTESATNSNREDHDCNEMVTRNETGNNLLKNVEDIPKDNDIYSFVDKNGNESHHGDTSVPEIEPDVVNMAVEFAKLNFKIDAILKWTGRTGGTIQGKYSLPLKSEDELSGWDEEVSSDNDAFNSAVCLFIY